LYAQLWQGRDRFLPYGSLNLYLHAAARHRVLDQLRGARRAERAAEQYVEWMRWDGGAVLRETDAQVGLEHSELIAAVRRAVLALPARSREVWHLHREQGLSYQDIATLLGISVNTVKTLMTRAARTIRLAAAPFLLIALFFR
jgi:RNA polymerase sigma-70 factor (ECF subfamily)